MSKKKRGSLDILLVYINQHLTRSHIDNLRKGRDLTITKQQLINIPSHTVIIDGKGYLIEGREALADIKIVLIRDKRRKL